MNGGGYAELDDRLAAVIRRDTRELEATRAEMEDLRGIEKGLAASKYANLCGYVAAMEVCREWIREALGGRAYDADGVLVALPAGPITEQTDPPQ